MFLKPAKVLIPLVMGFFFACPSNLLAQSAIYKTPVPSLNITPVSPEASALARFGEIPVGLYTGVPEIDIPVYTIKLKNLNIPIKLSYHSAGVKVNDLASNVGLGWALIAGGTITTAVHGIPDLDLAGKGWYNTASRSSHVHEAMKSSWADSTVFTIGQLYYNNEGELVYPTNSQEYQFLYDVSHNEVDTQPDLFYVNLGGRSFKFYFDSNKNIHTVPYQRVKMAYENGAFTLIDENDNLYVFSGIENNRTQYQYTGESSNASGYNPLAYGVNNYYLTKITTPLGEVVDYVYDRVTYSFSNQMSESRFSILSSSAGFGCEDGFIQKNTTSVTDVNGARLAKIISSTGDSVVFSYDMIRSDLPGTKALTGVNAYYKLNPANIKSFSFSYGYFSTQFPGTSPDNLRLKLESITETGSKPYLFDYDLSPMASRITGVQDHWGYNNGIEGATTLLPVDISKGFSSGVSREPLFSAAKAGILQKITYPTGGSTSFEYESNDYLSSETSAGDELTTIGSDADPNNIVTLPFTVLQGSSEFKVQYSAPTGQVHDPQSDIGYYCTVRILTNTGTPVQTFSGSNGTNWTAINNLDPGEYKIEINSGGGCENTYLLLQFKNPPRQGGDAILVNKEVGGLRVRKITQSDQNGEVSSKYYSYKLNNSNNSSGHIAFKPEYTYLHYRYKVDVANQGIVRVCTYNQQSSTSMSPIGLIAGGPVAYTDVQVFDSINKLNGYSNHKFSYFGALGSEVGLFPMAPVIYYDWIDGLPTETIDYGFNQSNSSFFPLKKITKDYLIDFGREDSLLPIENITRGFSINVERPTLLLTSNTTSTQNTITGPTFGLRFYFLQSSWSYLKKTTETIYDQTDTTKKVISVQNYYHDNPNHIEVTRQEVSKSTGEKYNVVMRYPKDYNVNYPYNSSPLVEKRVMVDRDGSEKIVAGEITTFAAQAGALPVAYYSLNIDSSLSPSAVPLFTGSGIPANYEKRLDYKYDTNKNLTQIIKNSKVNTAYQWGYNNQYVVAECKNASNDEFYFEGFEESAVTGVTESDGHTGTRSFSGNFVTSNKIAPGYHNRNYVITYWYKSGSVWLYSGELNYTGQTLTGNVDDVRIYPVDSQMITSTYDPLVGVKSVTDAKGQTSYYNYDNFQRLWYVKDQNGNILKQMDYHYQNQ